MKKLALITAVFVSASLSAGCAVDPETGERSFNKTGMGAAIGAAVGATAGIATSSSSKKRKKRALAGAGIGALAGTGIGYYMDKQEKEMREKLGNSDVDIERDGDNIILNMPGNITFDTDSYTVKSSFDGDISSVAEVLSEYDQTMIEVAGHTDSTGQESYNQTLSEKRAQAVADKLAQKGVNSVRFDVVGYASQQPIASNDTTEGRAQNRRVEMTIIPYTEDE